MNINEIKAEYREEMKGAMSRLFAMQQSGKMDVPTFLKAQGRLFDHYKALSSKAAPKAAKTTKAAPKATAVFRVRDLTSFIPTFLGDLYPSRKAAESFRETLPLTVQMASEVVVA